MFKRILITSGPTREPLDPIRFLSNRSSGKTGAALARRALEIGVEEVIFVTGPVCRHPSGVRIHEVETAVEMKQAVFDFRSGCEVIIMAAAVSDYRCQNYSHTKIKKKAETRTLTLSRNPDILRELGEKKTSNQILVGFAAETSQGLENARIKVREKNLDLLVLNEIGPDNPVFNSNYNQVTLIWKDRHRVLRQMEKEMVACRIWDAIVEIKKSRG
jgi:phosphopantothenoylcysteine decarboxylase/phosphopantothenate--cysteine ligase